MTDIFYIFCTCYIVNLHNYIFHCQAEVSEPEADSSDVMETENLPQESDVAEIEEYPQQPLIEEMPVDVFIQEVSNDEGEPVKQTVRKRVIKKKQGDKEQNIEVVTVEEEGKEPETVITIEMTELDEEQTSKTPKKKKVVKKIKDDDLDYIQKLIDMDIPKTELEVFEKPEFELTPKSPKEKKKPQKKKVPSERKEVIEPEPEKVVEHPAEVEEPEQTLEEPITVELSVEELPGETVQREIVNEEGEIVKQVVKKKIFKKKQGPREEVIEVQTIEEEGKEPQTVITLEQHETEEKPSEEAPKPRKKKIVKKIKPSDDDDYIQRLIDADIPKTELESFEKPEFGLTPKKVKKPKKHEKEADIADQLEDVIPEKSIIIEPEQTTVVESRDDLGEPIKQTVKKRVITKKEGPKEERIEITTVEEEGKEPSIEVTINEVMPEELATVEDTKPKHKKVTKKVKKEDKDDYIQSLIDMEIPKTLLEMYEKPEFETRQKDDRPDEERPQIQEQPLEIMESHVTNDEGETVKQVVKRKVLKKRQGSKEEIIQITTVEEEGKEPEVVVVVEHVQPDDVYETSPSDEDKPKPKKKRVVKKLKYDDHDDYIRKLIEADIPKTELEVFEKPEFDVAPKSRKSSLPESKVRDKPKKTKPKKEISEKRDEDIVPEETSEIIPEPQITEVETTVEEQPVEIFEREVPNDDGQPVKQIIKKRTIKKQQGPKQEIIEVTTVEEDGKEPQIEISVQELAPSTPEEKDKPKKKKIVRKVKKDDEDDYIRQLIEAEIPKTELEVFERPEFDTSPKTKRPEDVEPEDIKDTKEKPKKKKRLEKHPQSETEEAVQQPEAEEIAVEQKPVEVEQTPLSPQKDEPIVEDVPEKKKIKKEKIKKPDIEAQLIVDEPELVEMTTPEETLPVDDQTEAKIAPEEILQPIEHPEETQEVDSDSVTETVPEIEEVSPKDSKSPSKLKKKKPKKPASTEEDEYIKRLLEQDISKTELEKYEKIEIEKSKKPTKPEYAHLEPIKIERKEQKPTKVKILTAEELPQPIRLKPKKPKLLEKEVVEEKIPTRKLKSRITHVEVQKPIIPKITDLKTKRDRGELSRNVEEAEEVLKTKVKKFKHIKKRKDSLERPELEKYERYESSSDESSKGKSYQRPEKTVPPKEDIENKTLKLGKGKPKPEEETPEQVKLRPVPDKKVAEEATVELKPQKQVKEKDQPIEEEPKSKHKLKPIDGLDFEPYEVPKEEPEQFDFEKESKPKKVDEKPKPAKKKKSKPEPETIQHPIVPGTLN